MLPSLDPTYPSDRSGTILGGEFFNRLLVVTLSPKREQMLKQLWREIQGLFPAFQRRFPSADLVSGILRVRGSGDDTWSAHAYGAGVGAEEKLATRAQGWHAPRLLLIHEEMPGIHDAIVSTLDHTVTGKFNRRLGLGNPTYKGDTLHQFCVRPSVRHIRASAMDHPNVVCDREIVPGAVGRASIERRKEDWAHAPGVIEARIHGISPDQAHGAVFRVPDAATVSISDEEIRRGVESGWHVNVGLDFGENHFAAVFGVLDSDGVVTIVREYTSFREDLDTRFDRVLEILDDIGATGLYKGDSGLRTKVRLWGDPAGPWLVEGNASLKRLGARMRVGWKAKAQVKRATSAQKDYVSAGISKINRLFGQGSLRIAEGLTSTWRRGAGGSSPGRPMDGSRLRWELANLQWDERRNHKPNKDSADGAHMSDALRYLVGGLRDNRKAKTPKERLEKARRTARVAEEVARPVMRTLRDLPPARVGDRDMGLERISARRRAEDLSREPRLRRGNMRRLAELQQARKAERAKEEAERRERMEARAEEVRKERTLREIGGTLEEAAQRAGLSMDEAVDRLLGLAEGEN